MPRFNPANVTPVIVPGTNASHAKPSSASSSANTEPSGTNLIEAFLPVSLHEQSVCTNEPIDFLARDIQAVALALDGGRQQKQPPVNPVEAGDDARDAAIERRSGIGLVGTSIQRVLEPGHPAVYRNHRAPAVGDLPLRAIDELPVTLDPLTNQAKLGLRGVCVIHRRGARSVPRQMWETFHVHLTGGALVRFGVRQDRRRASLRKAILEGTLRGGIGQGMAAEHGADLFAETVKEE